ncbi:MAG TPA: trypsin-like peptidase domain-containing protein [archaeon]|nr:trypsin-like peptidase domain-containing protein [archaeon]
MGILSIGENIKDRNIVFFFMLLLFSSTVFTQSSITGNAVSLPDVVPGIISQTAQKDKAAVVMITTDVSGTWSMPSFELIEIIDSDVIGVWQLPEGTITSFDLDGRWETAGLDGFSNSGFFETNNGRIKLFSDEGIGFIELNYYIAIDDSLILTNPENPNDWIAYEYVGPAPAQQDIYARLNNLVLVRDESVEGTILSNTIETGTWGTGFIISPDGYIVTNAHVLLADEDPETLLLNQLGREFAESLIQESAPAYNIPDEEKQIMTLDFLAKIGQYFDVYGRISGIEVKVHALNGIASPGEDLRINRWRAEIKKIGEVSKVIDGEPIPSTDVAIIKVQQSNLPTVKLGNPDKMQPGDSVFVIGYPSAAQQPIFREQEKIEPTVSQGVISARKTLRTGIETFQTDASILGGNSGGPAYNTQGEVIGIATFGVTEGAGVNWLLSANLAKEFMNELNIKNVESVVDGTYDEALEAFWNKKCFIAVEKLKSVLVLYPGHPYANDYLTECERAIIAGEITEEVDTTLLGGIIIMVFVIAVAVIFFFIGKGKTKKTHKKSNR